MINDKMGVKELPAAGVITEHGNSEQFNTGEWRNRKPKHLLDKCKHCMMCVPVCPDCAIIHSEEDKMCGFDYSKCKGCGVCSAVCPFKAIEMVDEDCEVDE
ncbi:MAG: 4Fe-4S binding protein [Clostridia bacterium]|nr:4Fe-4S binding protein [Clostridia bacterium]